MVTERKTLSIGHNADRLNYLVVANFWPPSVIFVQSMRPPNGFVKRHMRMRYKKHAVMTKEPTLATRKSSTTCANFAISHQ